MANIYLPNAQHNHTTTSLVVLEQCNTFLVLIRCKVTRNLVWIPWIIFSFSVAKDAIESLRVTAFPFTLAFSELLLWCHKPNVAPIFWLINFWGLEERVSMLCNSLRICWCLFLRSIILSRGRSSLRRFPTSTCANFDTSAFARRTLFPYCK